MTSVMLKGTRSGGSAPPVTPAASTPAQPERGAGRGAQPTRRGVRSATHGVREWSTTRKPGGHSLVVHPAFAWCFVPWGWGQFSTQPWLPAIWNRR